MKDGRAKLRFSGTQQEVLGSFTGRRGKKNQKVKRKGWAARRVQCKMHKLAAKSLAA